MKHRKNNRRRGITLMETSVATTTATVGIAILAVTMGAGLGDRTRMRSAANLFVLGQAHHAYAMDWMGRQLTRVPDELDEYDGNIALYNNEVRCLDSIIMGEDAQGSTWGWWVGGNTCEDDVPGNSGYWNSVGFNFFPPYSLDSQSGWDGSSVNYYTRGFRDYVSGKTYDPTFFQPGTVDAGLASVVFDENVEFPGIYHPNISEVRPTILYPGYEIAASAMWGVDVHRAASAGGWQDPRNITGGYASPSVDQCLHPDLKTRMMERAWLYGAPSRFNPSFVGGGPGEKPGVHWQFNQGHAARPLSLFFDGSIARVRTGDAYDDDLRFQKTSGGDGLWSRDTPMGADGLYGSQGVDDFTSFHVLTTDGIRGRDFLSREDG